MALAGALACQRDSYLKELTTRVKSCEPSQLSTVVDGKKQKLNGYQLTLEDTVLFPEGGGQPDDRGRIDGVEVLRVTRRGGDALHFVPTPFDLGSEVKLEVDWTRRWDHMQQHSGQHLITAIADRDFGFPTTSWNLGEKTSFIELDTTSMSNEQMQRLERLVNAKITQGLKMYPTLYEGIHDPALTQVRTRGLPDDHVGPIRVVTIETVDNNTCCGTHVSSLTHLQSIKLLTVEKGKKGKINLVFVAGERVLEYLGECYTREKQFTSYLKGHPEQHVELLDKLQKSFKVAQKNATSLLREVAVMEAERYKSQENRAPYLFQHRREGDNEYMNIIINEINDENVVVFVSVGDDKGSGLFVLSGPEDFIADISPKVGDLLEGKGATKRGRYQGKANKLSRRHLVEKLILEKLGLARETGS